MKKNHHINKNTQVRLNRKLTKENLSGITKVIKNSGSGLQNWCLISRKYKGHIKFLMLYEEKQSFKSEYTSSVKQKID